jgi:hypothetical protein
VAALLKQAGANSAKAIAEAEEALSLKVGQLLGPAARAVSLSWLHVLCHSAGCTCCVTQLWRDGPTLLQRLA